MVCTVHTILMPGRVSYALLSWGWGGGGWSYHVHQHVCQHAHAYLVVAPCLLQAFQELLAGYAPLVGAGRARALGLGEEVGREQLLDEGADICRQPIALEVVDFVVQLLALLLEDDAVCVAIELLIRQLGGVLGVDFAEGQLDKRPCVLKVDFIAVETLYARHCQQWLRWGVATTQ
jgi:hypothetical protein